MSRAIPDPNSPGEKANSPGEKANSPGEKASSPGEEAKDDNDKASDDEIDMELDDNEESTKTKEDENKKDEIDDIDLGLDSDNEEEKQDEQTQDKKLGSDDLEDGEIPDVEEKLPAASKFDELDLNSLPAEGRWRQGVTCKHSPIIFFRFATKDDRKQRGAEKRSKYYQKYGNPNFGFQRGLISSSKRQRLYEARRQLDEQDAGLSAEAQEEISGLTRDMSEDDYDSTGEKWEEVEESDEQEEVDEEGANLAREVAELTRTSYSMRMRADDEEHRRNTSRSSRLGRSRDYLKGVSAQSRLGFKGVRSRLGKRTMSSRLGY